MGLSGVMLGLLEASPHLSKAILRIPFGAWVDQVGGKRLFLILLALTIVGMIGVTTLFHLYYPADFDKSLYPYLIVFGLLAGAGGATFSVGIPKTSYWYPDHRQGYALGFYAGAGNIGPGVFNYVIPLLIGLIGLTGAYASWLAFMVVTTLVYGWYAMDSYYFQLIRQGVSRSEAIEIVKDLNQNVIPSKDSWTSLKESARNRYTWILVFLYTVSFGGGFTALAAWFPIYWKSFHQTSLTTAGLFAGIFVVYGSLIRIPGGSLSDRYGGESIAILSFLTMALGAVILTLVSGSVLAFAGMMILGTGMGVANAAVFELVPVYIPDAVGGASGWIGGLGGAGTLIILPLLGLFTDLYGPIGYARGFVVFILLSLICTIVSYGLKQFGPVREASNASVVH
jgi:NNP family nitrate/nitrite transporter-like MFS transporter